MKKHRFPSGQCCPVRDPEPCAGLRLRGNAACLLRETRFLGGFRPHRRRGQAPVRCRPLEDGRLRILYGYDNSGDSRTVLCGSKVLYQSLRSETVNLLTDTVTGETNYWFRSWSDSTGRGGRRSALYDKDGNEVMAFDGEQSATIQNGLLVLQESRMVGDSYDVDYDSYGTCSVIDLATGKNLPVPEGAYSCIVCGDMLVFTCYARPADLAARRMG